MSKQHTPNPEHSESSQSLPAYGQRTTTRETPVCEISTPTLTIPEMQMALNLENANRRSAATRTGLHNPPAFPLFLNRLNQRLNMSAPVEDVARDTAIMTRSETQVLLTVWERENENTPQYVCKRWYASPERAQAAQEFFLVHGLEEYKRRAGLEFGAREWM